MSDTLKGEQLDEWIEQALRSGIEALKNFAQGLRQDYDTVKAALTEKWSNGPVEGQINRLKTIKRRMYGRAGFKLLKKRVLADTG
jgi:transposase